MLCSKSNVLQDIWETKNFANDLENGLVFNEYIRVQIKCPSENIQLHNLPPEKKKKTLTKYVICVYYSLFPKGKSLRRGKGQLKLGFSSDFPGYKLVSLLSTVYATHCTIQNRNFHTQTLLYFVAWVITTF